MDENVIIKELNDAFRTALAGGRIAITPSIEELGEERVGAIVDAVRAYDAFNWANDPDGEHDFGAFTDDGLRVCWKIDYYDTDCVYGSEDPTDPEKTTRVLTIMRAEEW